jgi:hypothetical protein
MLCHQARKRLNQYNWRESVYGQDKELTDHLALCHRCRSLVLAENTLRGDLATVRQEKSLYGPALNDLREKVETKQSRSLETKPAFGSFLKKGAVYLLPNTRYKFITTVVAVVVAIIALYPINAREKVGYEIGILGVDREIALDNHEIISLLDALGMEKGKASNLFDSTESRAIQLSVGECLETCHLKISDLKTEKDVQRLVRAIIELGCCQIDNINPIFRNQSTSLLRLAAQKLFS